MIKVVVQAELVQTEVKMLESDSHALSISILPSSHQELLETSKLQDV